MGKINEIWGGIRNALFTDPKVEEIAEKRNAICDTCESKVVDSDSEAFNRCYECGCMLVLKTRSLDSECPLGKWKRYNGE